MARSGQTIRLGGVARTPARIRRVARIARVLTRHGFDHVVLRLRLQMFFPALSRVVRRSRVVGPRPQISTPERLVLVLQDLGPTAVKLGQLLSARPDLVPEEYVEALRALQDRVAPFPSAVAHKVIERELRRPLAEVFAAVDPEPMAAGSLGQVYGARLRDGREVVVKVKRPGVDQIIRDDLDLLMLLAQRAERVEELRPYRPVRLVEELAKSLKRELDFVSEASYTEKFHQAFAEDARVKIPAVCWECTTPSVLTLERLRGTPIGRLEDLRAAGADPKRLARVGADVFMRQYFELGLFHADPHPGNLLAQPDGRLGIIDFGMVGHLDEERRRDLGAILVALVRQNLDMVVDVATELGAVPDDADLGALKSDLIEVLDKYYGVPIKRVDMKAAFFDAMRVLRRHELELPQDLVLLGKSFVTVVGQAMVLDPDLDISQVVRPHAKRLLRQRFSPVSIGRDMVGHAWQVTNLLRRLPRELRQFNRKMLSGRLQLRLRLQGLEDLGAELDRATNRVAFSMIVASVVIASSIVIHAKMRPYFGDIPGVGRWLGSLLPEMSIVGFAGYFLAGVMGMVLAVAIWRSGRL